MLRTTRTGADRGTLVPTIIAFLAVTIAGCTDASLTHIGNVPGGPVTTKLVVEPAEVTISAADSVQFQAYGLSASGDRTTVDLTWSTNGGTVQGKGQGNAWGVYRGGGKGKHKVVATDTSGVADTAVVTVLKPPTAEFTYAVADLDVTFTDASTDDDGVINAWSWDFGDGVGTSTRQNPVHSYASTGSYDVTLTVTDNDGLSGTITRSVTVTGPVESANTVPVATDVAITGTAVVGQELTGSYVYGDADGDAEGASTYRWLRNGEAIAGATSATYLLVVAEEGAQLRFEVTPVAATGASPGIAVQSDAVGPVESADTVPAAVAEFVELVNAHRVSVGCPALVWNAGVAGVAQAHSDDMVARDFFSHINPDGESPIDRLRAAGITFTGVLENIAYGYTSAQTVLQGWLDSPGHRANIQNCEATEHGVGLTGTHWTHLLIRP
jgi:uncharacterized protein YkwD